MESIANLIPAFNKVGEAADEATDQIIGFNRIVNGKPQWYALSGSDRRRERRAAVRRERNIQEAGQRAYNRQQRQIEFDGGTVRQQLRILRGELTVTPDMHRNLTNHIMRQNDLAEREQNEPQRKAEQEQRREARLLARSAERVRLGVARHRDFVRMGLREA